MSLARAASDAVAGPAPFGLTAVAGLEVGHFTDSRRPTGCTVVLATDGAVAGVDVRGAAPGTRETDLLAPLNTVDRVHAVLLAGGSAFGLDAAGGVMRWLDERGVGFAPLPADPTLRVPIVPAAILFDLTVGDPRMRPDAASGYAACEAASTATPAEGSVGAGAGASVGKLFGMERAMKAGVGTASICVDGVTVAALVAVNAFGDVVDPSSGRTLAGVRGAAGKPIGAMAALRGGEWPPALPSGAATTLAVVATDAIVGKPAASHMARMAHDGLARTINPVHSASDGDVVFALATGRAGRSAHVSWLGALAADVLAEAVLRAVRAAGRVSGPGVPDLPTAAELGTA
ncbi:P1 family peptidase [Piscinibacter koreensis]|uniref:P1 family peptidase n=1 Tax=Piscinibacter koreensis TaxID=2742824 RepID=A0A7Y6TXI4_9BURK|nr:P1 family peptidase [Schlegelella koreensis]NUZ07188.1 P1 family peptidase [Schlegelella koreensis]